ncbi:MAG: hypothetical protein ACU0B7_12585 [Paracoccaceae bacterium]|uniref:hypothetical protein n=1 Tax=Seohaeicola saemankumensis TaxID=481181 RepID=UPI001E47A4AE|nr:hypothetical protein [Seohaeicola saemankumensis]MCD1625339.1 hypothetical protein [Seohaeicola saemankumensis]
MQKWRIFGRQLLATAICLSLVVWSVLPTLTHVPTVLETLHEHAEMIAAHGHSHGLAEDLAWALHGHSHDAMDHDHNQAVLTAAHDNALMEHGTDRWRFHPAPDISSRVFRIDRPPRA